MENKIQALLAQTVTKSSAGGGAGSTLVLELKDTSYFFIWCSWRIQQGDTVIVTSSDTIQSTENNDSKNGLIGEKSPILEGLKVLNINLTPQYDLEIDFENEYKLKVFCDIGHSRDDYNVNWELNLPIDNLSIEIDNHFIKNEAPYDTPDNESPVEPPTEWFGF